MTQLPEEELSELKTGWLTTAASQIFIMTLGFTSFEVGFTKERWAKTIIIKNLEATIIGVIAYILFSHSLAASSNSWGGVIGSWNKFFLYNVELTNYELVFIEATYAVTATNIISGAVLERMKNSAFIVWCFLTILVNYSVASYWSWNRDSWLYEMSMLYHDRFIHTTNIDK